LETGTPAITGTPSPAQLDYTVGATYLYAHRPALVASRANPDRVRFPIVDGMHGLNLRGRVGITDRIAVGLEVPLVLSRSLNENFADMASAGLGDIAVHASYSLLSRHDSPAGLAFDGILRVPSGNPDDLMGNGALSGELGVTAD
ncbi:MAG: hypothetical protein ABEN55_13235, partial [Bradymonadaceae bacterium]